MALISCPQCGGQVSDSAEKCVHCGYNFELKRREEERAKQEANRKKEFNSLPENEQNRLMNEFYAKFPEEGNFAKLSKLYHVGGIVAYALEVVLFIIAAIVVILTSINKIKYSTGWTLFIVLGILSITAAVCVVLTRVYKNKFNIRYYQQVKRFARWLKNEKGLSYRLVLSSDEKTVYDKVQI